MVRTRKKVVFVLTILISCCYFSSAAKPPLCPLPLCGNFLSYAIYLFFKLFTNTASLNRLGSKRLNPTKIL
jgi:hypothetical protein